MWFFGYGSREPIQLYIFDCIYFPPRIAMFSTQCISVTLLTSLLFQAFLAAGARSYDKMSFTNVGFSGTFNPVKKLSNIKKDSCSCEVGSAESFSGVNAPLADYLSVHFRGPLSLRKFAFYSTASFSISTNRTSDDWTRLAYYDSSSQTTENVTFLTKGGESSPCLGNALSYASSNGTGYSDTKVTLEDNNSITSDQEYAIFSNVSCPRSSFGKGCGVYRDGIPALYGFGGVTKMFLFEFEMPTEQQKNSTAFEYYDLPAIWLLNDHIPRTSQYPTNTNCSCWSSGCGEFDIFESINGTQHNNLYSTFHTFQGIADLSTGIQSNGYFTRDTSGVMRGGVVFDSDGDTIAFLSSSTEFGETYSAEDVINLISAISKNNTYSTELASVTPSTATSTSKSGGISLYNADNYWYYVVTGLTTLAHIFMI